MPATETTHQGTTADNPFEVSRWMGEADHPMTWLRDEEAAGSNPATPTGKKMCTPSQDGSWPMVSDYASGFVSPGKSRSMTSAPWTITGRICLR